MFTIPSNNALAAGQTATFTVALASAPSIASDGTDRFFATASTNGTSAFSPTVQAANTLRRYGLEITDSTPNDGVTAGASVNPEMTVFNHSSVAQEVTAATIGGTAFDSAGSASNFPDSIGSGASGTVTFSSSTITSTDGAGKTVTGTASGSFISAPDFSKTITVDPAPAGASKLVFTSSEADLASGAPRDLTVELRDSSNEVVTDDSSTVVTFSKTAGDGTVTGLGTATADAGIATKTVTGVLAGSITIEATASGLTSDTTTFDVVAGPATQYLVTSSSSSPVAGAEVTITAQLADASGNPVATAGKTLTWSKTGTGGSFADPTSDTNASGVATVAFTTSTTAGVTYNFTATDADELTGTSGNVTTVAGPATQLFITANPESSYSADAEDISTTIEVRDANGNVVTTHATDISLALLNANGATLGGTTSKAPTNGVATFDDLFVREAGTGYALRASSGALATADTTTFSITPGVPAALVIATHPNPTYSADDEDITIVVEVEDDYGNKVTGATPEITLTLLNANGATLGGNTTKIALGGEATFNDLFVRKAGTGYALRASSGALATADTTTFSVVAGAPAKYLVTASDFSPVAGSDVTITAQLADANDNPVAEADRTVNWSSTNGGSFSASSSTTNSSGVATVTFTTSTTAGTTHTVTATDDADASITGTSDDITTQAAGAAQLKITTPPRTTTAGFSTDAITVELQDPNGNPVAAEPGGLVVNLTATGTATGIFRDSLDLVTITSVTIPEGSSSASFRFYDTTAGTPTITVHDQGTPGNPGADTGLTDDSQGVTVNPGPATDIRVETEADGSGTVVSAQDVASGASLTAYAISRDTHGNFVDNVAAEAWSLQDKTGGVADADLVAAGDAKSATFTADLVGSAKIRAAASGLDSVDSGTITVVHGDADHIDVTGNTEALASGATRVITATVKDAAGNTVATGAGASASITFAQNGTGTVTGLTGAETAENGVATKTVTGDAAGEVTISATGNSGALTSGATTTLTVVPASSATKIVFTSSEADLTSGAGRTLTAELRDASDNLLTSDSSTEVTFAQTSGSGTVTGLGSATASNGVASKNVTGELAGEINITASAASLTSDTTTFTVTHGFADHVDVTTDTTDLASGSTRVVTGTVKDAAGNTVDTGTEASASIDFAQTGDGSVTGLAGAESAENGVATKTVTGDIAGEVTISATGDSGALTSGATTAFTVIPGNAARLAFTSSEEDLNSGAARDLTVRIEDAAGNLVTSDSSTEVTFAKESGDGTVTGLGNATASSGLATKTVTGELAGEITISASAGSLTTDTTTFEVVHGAADHIDVTSSTEALASGATRVVTATVKDAAGNTVDTGAGASASITFAQSGTGTVTGLAGAETAENGVATKTVTGDTAGSVTISATGDSGTLSSAATTTFDVIAGPAAKYLVAASNSTPLAGSDVTITAQLADTNDNPVETADVEVNWSKTGDGGSFASSTSTTNASGVATVEFTTSATAGTVHTVTATTDAITGTSDDITTQAAGAAQLKITTPERTTTAGTATDLITVELQDSNGNPVDADEGGQLVRLHTTSGTGTFLFPITLIQITEVTIPEGLSSASFHYRDTASGEHTITVHDQEDVTPDTGLTDDTQTVTINPDDADAAESTLTPTEATITADGTATQTLTVTAKDAFGNDVGAGGATVTITKSSGSGEISSVTDNADGTYTATVTAPTTSGSGVFVATLDGSAVKNGTETQTESTIIYAAGAAAKYLVTSSNSAPLAGSDVTITAQLADDNDNPVATADVTVTWTSTNGGSFSDETSDTDASGIATVELSTSTISGTTHTVTATDGEGRAGTTNITTQAAGPAQLKITTPPRTATAGFSTDAITVQLQDSNGNPVDADSGGQLVRLHTTSGTGTFRDAMTDLVEITTVTIPEESSSASFLYRDATAGEPTITVHDQVDPNDDTELTDDTQTVTVDPSEPGPPDVTGSSPTVTSRSITAKFDTARTVVLEGNDADGDEMTFSIVSGPGEGSLSSIGDGSCTSNGGTKTCTAPVTYTPPSGVPGSDIDSFEYKATDAGGLDSNVATVTVSVTEESGLPSDKAEQNAPAGGTVSTGREATPEDPIATLVTTPNAAEIVIEEGAITTPAPANWSFFGQKISISAPAADVNDPLRIVFRIDASVIPAGTTISDVGVYRGVEVPDGCEGGIASPDPCVDGRVVETNGNFTITVLTSEASNWNLGVPLGAPPPPPPPPPLEATVVQNHDFISPNGNGRKDEMELEVTFNREAIWTLTVTEADGEAGSFSPEEMSERGVFSTGGQAKATAVSWDGTGALEDGRYDWVLEASDGQGVTMTPVVGSVVVDRVAPVIRRQRVNRRPFRLFRHGIQRVTFRTNEATTNRVRIRRKGRLVATLPHVISTPRGLSAWWNGLNRKGRLVRPGVFRVVIRSEDRAGNVTFNGGLRFRAVRR